MNQKIRWSNGLKQGRIAGDTGDKARILMLMVESR